jgi:hypothetical protein
MKDLRNKNNGGFAGKKTHSGALRRGMEKSETLSRLRLRNAKPFPSDTLNAYLLKK